MSKIAETRSDSRIRIRRLSGALGAEVEGVNLSQQLDSDSFAEIRQAFLEHLVLVFPNQRITPAEQVAFTERFGPVEPHPLGARRSREEHPAVLVFENRKGRPGARNDFWHSDVSFAEKPPLGSVLYALQVTEGRGDTMFCNMYAAYEGLSRGLKRWLGQLQGVHTSAPLVERNRTGQSDGLPITNLPPPVEHPVVRTHPDAGRKALFVNPYFTSHFAGMTEEESQPLLHFLYSKATKAENVFRHRWRAFDVVMWDNRCTMHYAVLDYDDTMPRLMNRTTAGGDRPV